MSKSRLLSLIKDTHALLRASESETGSHIAQCASIFISKSIGHPWDNDQTELTLEIDRLSELFESHKADFPTLDKFLNAWNEAKDKDFNAWD